MVSKAIPARRADPVVQFSVFTANKLGRLHDLISMLGSHAVHVLAMTVLDTTDSTIIRLVVDDPDKARDLMRENDFPFTESKVLVVEVDAATELHKVIQGLLEAEININYLYSFIPHPRGKSLLAISMEDNEIGEQCLKRHGFSVLRQSDISR
ncbi:MAG: acetolactate synthase [Acidobacteria bacterium]|nr:MAG: acetolactate synthase [Acidobacteriota bacterium]